jgi:hypothetical protein
MFKTARHRNLFIELLLILGAAGTLWAFSSGPPSAHTGDFGQPTCQVCHLGNSLNAAGGTFTISGVPANYSPGQTYPIQVTITKAGQQRWGFELATRLVGTGQQAGTLASTSQNTQTTTFSGVQYISHTTTGTFNGTAQGTWTFNWTAPPTAVGNIAFGAAGNAANGNFANNGDFIYTARVVTAPVVEPNNPITLLFPQIAVGGGYRTVFSLLNIGGDAIAGDLSLWNENGTPMIVSIGSTQTSSIPVNISSGGTQVITADSINANDPTIAGWAKLESVGGTPAGVATYQFSSVQGLEAIVGVLSSPITDISTVPVNENVLQNRSTGYAITNPGTENVNIRIVQVDSNGVEVQTIRPALLNPLPPDSHYDAFLFEDVNNPNLVFNGSLVFISDGAIPFSMVAIVLNQGLFTAVPTVTGKAPGIGN